MKIQGQFIDKNNDITYWVQIGNVGQTLTIKDAEEYDPDDTTGIFFSDDPVTITSDMSDTFANVYMRQCTINLRCNFDIRPYVVAGNYTDIPVEIRYDDAQGNIIFSGSVIPLNFNQDYAYQYNVFSLDCVDKLGVLDYIKVPKIAGIDVTNYNTPRYFIEQILNECNFSSIIYNIDYDHTTDTKINPIIFVGESEDDYMTCKEALEEIGKIYGCYFYQNGDTCVVENILLYDLSNAVNVDKDDYMSDDTNISISEAFNRIKCTVDLSTIDDTFIDPFADEFMQCTTKDAERVLTELAYKNREKTYDIIDYIRRLSWAVHIPVINWSNQRMYYDSKSGEFDVYDNYCQIIENKSFTFPSPNYLIEGLGSADKDAYKTLQWLWDHPGKGAFLAFGKTEDIINPENDSVIKAPQMENALVIQVNGDRQASDYNDIETVLENQIEANKPICEFTQDSSQNIVPQQGSVNYLVIQGKITLNPITPRLCYGAYNGIDCSTWRDSLDPDESEYRDPWVAWRMGACPINSLVNYWETENPTVSVLPLYCNYDEMLWQMVTSKDGDDKGVYYQYYTWENLPEGVLPPTVEQAYYPYWQNPNFARKICLPYLSPKFEKFKYENSYYNGSNLPQDRVKKLAILACELKIGDKYLVEDITKNPNTTMIVPQIQYGEIYKWRTLEECPDDGQGNKQTWFTIGVDPAIGDTILGKEWSIQDTVANWMKIGSESGLAIPIPGNAGLLGPVSFKILGPYNASWAHAYQTMHHKFLFWKCYHDHVNYVPILAFVENIIIKDFKIKFCQQNQNTSNNQNNDLVYYSYENKKYLEEQEFNCKFCTGLTQADVTALGINYEQNNSTIMQLNNTPCNGISYKGSSGVKFEEARVKEQYNIWKRPRNIIETTIKLINPEAAYLKTNYIFDYLKYDNNTYQIYRTLGREIDLKQGTMKCFMKELSDEA